LPFRHWLPYSSRCGREGSPELEVPGGRPTSLVQVEWRRVVRSHGMTPARSHDQLERASQRSRCRLSDSMSAEGGPLPNTATVKVSESHSSVPPFVASLVTLHAYASPALNYAPTGEAHEPHLCTFRSHVPAPQNAKGRFLPDNAILAHRSRLATNSGRRHGRPGGSVCGLVRIRAALGPARAAACGGTAGQCTRPGAARPRSQRSFLGNSIPTAN